MQTLWLSESSLAHRLENGWYHVLNRGIDGRQLFPDDRANEHFLELLKSMPARFGLRIHAFVLMGNHYHLQIETLKPDLSRTRQQVRVASRRETL
jgi:putative transposase